jgi:Gas vesicle protein
MAVQQQALARSDVSLADVLERVLDKGIVIAGDIKLFIGQVELLTLQIRLVVCSIDKAKEMGMDWWTGHPSFSPYKAPQPGAPEEPPRKPEEPPRK